jgi:hypothetical protein
MSLWYDPSLNQNQAFKCSLSHCYERSIVLIHKLRFMLSIPWNFCNTFFAKPIWKGGCEIEIHDIRCILDLHLVWVVFQLDVANAINSVSRKVIFQKLRVIGGDIIQFIHFVHAFYAFESPLFYNHCNREGDVTIIPFAMETRQGDPLGRALFVLAHFRVLHSTANHFPSCFHPL